MPLPWFRRKNSDSAVDEQPHAAALQLEPLVVEPPAEELAATDAVTVGDTSAARKRRRGNRGGKGRRKPVGEGGEAAEGDGAAEPAAASAEAKDAKEPRERGGRGRGGGEGRASGEGRGSRGRERERDPHREAERQRRKQLQRRAPLPAAKRELLISVDVGEQRVAVLEDGKVAEVYLERPERRSIAGNIYKGIVDNVLPGMEAAFIEMGLEKNGFLYVDEIVTPELEGRRHGKKIQDLIQRGEEIIVQAVKDPMKTKGARLTTEVSLPGRFVVFVPYGEGLGVSRRLDDDERTRLKDIVKKIEIPTGGLIVRTAAEGASAEDIERDIVFLQRLWKSIQARAKTAPAPSLIYQEAELPLRVVRDLFTGDFERCLVDNDQALKRIVGYLKKTSPHMVERITRYKETPPLFEAYGIDAEIRSTLSRRVDLPSGGYLVFDYAEAFTIIDVNTGRFVGSRSKTSTQRLEDTIVKNNLEAVTEVVRQLRLRDVGGIIVIDFIDMANPKNRQAVEEALKNELERDRTKTYVVEISPLGLVEMTRQNVTDGPRELLTKKCPTCSGDGIVVSETTAAVDAERRLRALAAGSKSAVFKVELNARVASILIGTAAHRLKEIEAATKRRFLIVGRDGIHTDHFTLVQEGTVEQLLPAPPIAEGASVELKLVELGLYDAQAGIAKLDGVTYIVAEAARLVGKKVTARVERYLDGVAYATLLDPAPKRVEEPITAESEAEKPTRQPRRKPAAVADGELEGDETEELSETEELAESDELDAAADADADAETAAETGSIELGPDGLPRKKRTRRGSRGGRGRTQPVGEGGETSGAAEGAELGTTAGESLAGAVDESAVPAPDAAAAAPARAPRRPRIHVPGPEVGRTPDAPVVADGTAPVETASALAIAPLRVGAVAAEAGAAAEGAVEGAGDGAAVELGPDGLPRKKRTRRGSRGGRGRSKRPAAEGGADGAALDDAAEGEDDTAEAIVGAAGVDADDVVNEPDTEIAAVTADTGESIEVVAPDAEPALAAAPAAAPEPEGPAPVDLEPADSALWQPVSLADIPDDAWGDTRPRRGSR